MIELSARPAVWEATTAEVRGTALALLLAVSGRRVAPEELDGPGITALVTPRR
ncbi:hypothetical protein ABZ092_06025 [Streptomyces bobili]|uniref:hypothetical protein n=1 Tax=Streptomyces bobili TaxID=67280 RepID=UPI0033A1ECF2